MNHLAQRLVLVFSVMGMAWYHGCTSVGNQSDDEKIVRVLSAIEVRFTTDGAGGSDLSRKVAVRNIIDEYGGNLIPILIKNLANPTTSVSVVDGKPGVSVGYVCFDVLATIIKNNATWYPNFECGDDGLWACVREDLVVPMLIDNTNVVQSREAQRKWQQLYDEGKIRLDPNYSRFWDQEMLQ